MTPVDGWTRHKAENCTLYFRSWDSQTKFQALEHIYLQNVYPLIQPIALKR